MSTDRQRPLSPHLQVYRPQLTSITSTLHRISGVLLSLGSLVLVAWLLALAAGPGAFEALNGWLAHPVAVAAMVVWTWLLVYHLLNGIRHLCWDAGWFLELGPTYVTGWLVVIASFVLTALVWAGGVL